MSSSEKLIIKQLEIGPMQNFIYFIGDPISHEVAVVDPAWEIKKIQDEIRANNWQIACILLTHGHPDHIQGVGELQRTYPVPVYLSKEEPDFYTPDCQHCRRTVDGQKITIGQIEITCLATPGHSPGSQCFYSEPVLLTGDTLFISGCGRCDLPGGDVRQLYQSLYEKILKLPGETVIYPGHRYGPAPFMILKELKSANPYLQFQNQQDFIDDMER